MNRRNFILGLALAPVLVKEALNIPRYIVGFDPIREGGCSCGAEYGIIVPKCGEPYVVDIFHAHEYGCDKIYAKYGNGEIVHVADVRGEC